MIHFSSVSSSLGEATVFDLDIFLVCMTVLVERMSLMERGELEPDPNLQDNEVAIRVDDLLEISERSRGGKNRERIMAAIRRLRDTRVEFKAVSKITGETEVHHVGGWINDGTYVEYDRETGAPAHIRIAFSRWTMTLIHAHRNFRFGPELFRMRGALERRIHMMLTTKAIRPERRYKGNTLHDRCAPEMEVRKFRHMLRQLRDGSSAFADLYTIVEGPSNMFTFLRNALRDDVDDTTLAFETDDERARRHGGDTSSKAKRSRRSDVHRQALLRAATLSTDS